MTTPRESDRPPSAPLTYASYLKVPELLALQQPRSPGPEHDEMLFIVIHQVYELWFKQMLWEGDHLSARLAAGERPTAQATLRRMLTILKTLVAQIDVLETMTPVSFLSFRARLESASGFQSAQFREFEFLLGNKRPGVIERYDGSIEERTRLERRMAAPSLWDAFLRFLAASGISVPPALLARDVREAPQPSEPLQEALLALYHGEPDLRVVCELMVDLDEGVQEWRYRHVKMVERTIGMRGGTGGSAGVGYLVNTLFRPAFPDLWAIRTRL
ncbi:MAG: tryptophan 2,3-dioxygenase [Phycisphaerae bacterium]|nr:tryptophan 2,3-dioxygenase [Phycisphaerae bacterium]